MHLTQSVNAGTGVSVAVRLSVAPAERVPALRLAAHGVVRRVDPQPDGGYGVAVQFTRRRIL